VEITQENYWQTVMERIWISEAEARRIYTIIMNKSYKCKENIPNDNRECDIQATSPSSNLTKPRSAVEAKPGSAVEAKPGSAVETKSLQKVEKIKQRPVGESNFSVDICAQCLKLVERTNRKISKLK
jgi:hypothetical protein